MKKLLVAAAIVVITGVFPAQAEPPCTGDPDGDGPEPAVCQPCDSLPAAPSGKGCYMIIPDGRDAAGVTPVCVGGDAESGTGCIQVGVNHACTPFGIGCAPEHCAEAAAAGCGQP